MGLLDFRRQITVVQRHSLPSSEWVTSDRPGSSEHLRLGLWQGAPLNEVGCYFHSGVFAKLWKAKSTPKPRQLPEAKEEIRVTARGVVRQKENESALDNNTQGLVNEKGPPPEREEGGTPPRPCAPSPRHAALAAPSASGLSGRHTLPSACSSEFMSGGSSGHRRGQVRIAALCPRPAGSTNSHL